MWMNKAERVYRRKLEERQMKRSSDAANGRFAIVTSALTELLSDPGGRAALAAVGIDAVRLGRSMRFGDNGRAEGLCILEGIVLAGIVSHLFDDTAFVRYLSVHQPVVLARLHGASVQRC